MRTSVTVLLSFFLFLMSCNPSITHVPKDIDFFLCDFTKYQKQGFSFTPYDPNNDNYESMGFIDVTVYPEMNYRLPTGFEKKKTKLKTDLRNHMDWYPEEWITTEDVLDIVFEKAVKMGANTVCNVSITSAQKLILKYPKDGYKFGIRVSGWAINQRDR